MKSQRANAWDAFRRWLVLKGKGARGIKIPLWPVIGYRLPPGMRRLYAVGNS